MSVQVRDGRFDVVIAAGPRVALWPSSGVRLLSSLCGELGLMVGQFGGEQLRVRGVIPAAGSGGLVIAEDAQRRIHRLRARAVVRVGTDPTLPDPFEGWRSPGLIPLWTARALSGSGQLPWAPRAVILGTGNAGLQFGAALLESGQAPEVLCIETSLDWGAKRFAGWEVNRRRFEMAGGRIVEAQPRKLVELGPMRWELTIEDAFGVTRALEVARVVSAGPFASGSLGIHGAGVREYPPSSLLFELEQTALETRERDVEGWVLEEERARLLAGRIARALVTDLGAARDDLDRLHKRARGRLRNAYLHREQPFAPVWEGKWVAPASAHAMRAFTGSPKLLQRTAPIASIECFEQIPCNSCARACPTQAIVIGQGSQLVRKPGQGPAGEILEEGGVPVLAEDRCVSCGLCVVACPSQATLLVHERDTAPTSFLTLAWRGSQPWKKGEFAVLLNRRGDELGSARVVDLPEAPEDLAPKSDVRQLVKIEIPNHLVWEVRALKKPKGDAVEDAAFFEAIARSESPRQKVEVTLNGERRLLRESTSVSTALFENGQARARDLLLCPDGSCGLCQLEIDGVKKLACQTPVHRGMAIKFKASPDWASDTLCACMDISSGEVSERLKQGDLRTPEAVLSVCGVGEGKCHGQLCTEAFRRLLSSLGIEASAWVDWRFPWSEWTFKD